jgi:lipopolysaccharide export LptBFGC system permease protein LptF
MVLIRYICKRFLAHFFIVSTLLALLFNFIEFFEKLMRAKHVGVGAILHFISLNFAPSLFDLMPLASWLATILLIKEFHQQNEWENFSILGITRKTIFKTILIIGTVLFAFHMVCKEKCILPLAFKSEHFKMETFKQHATQKIVSKWLLLDNNIFCYFSILDIDTAQGQELIILSLSPSFSIMQTIKAPIFYIDTHNQHLIIPHGYRYIAQENNHFPITDERLKLPSFFSQLQINIEIPSITNLSKHLIFNRNFLPESVKNELLATLLHTITSSLQIILYPLLTLCLLWLFPINNPLQWALIFTPYPIVVLCTTLIDFMLAQGAPALLILIPYLIIMFFIALCYRKVL